MTTTFSSHASATRPNITASCPMMGLSWLGRSIEHLSPLSTFPLRSTSAHLTSPEGGDSIRKARKLNRNIQCLLRRWRARWRARTARENDSLHSILPSTGLVHGHIAIPSKTSPNKRQESFISYSSSAPATSRLSPRKNLPSLPSLNGGRFC